MDLRLHANATTTPRMRACIQSSPSPVAALARELGVSETTIRRWRTRSDTLDRSHTRHALGRSMSPDQEAIIATLRRDGDLSLDDITEVMRRCMTPALSRSAIWRCLRRLGLSGPQTLPGAAGQSAAFDPVRFGFVHVDLKHLGKLKSLPAFVFVAIERVSRFAHIEVIPDRGQETVAAAMQRFLGAFGYPVHTVLTDNGAGFTDRFRSGARAAKDPRPTGQHPFDRLCKAHGIRHRLTRPYRPQTNGMVERFNRRLSEAMHALPQVRDNSRHRTRFLSHADRQTFLLRFAEDYNRTRLRCLSYKAPLEVLANQAGDNTPGGRFASIANGVNAVPVGDEANEVNYCGAHPGSGAALSQPSQSAPEYGSFRLIQTTRHQIFSPFLSRSSISWRCNSRLSPPPNVSAPEV